MAMGNEREGQLRSRAVQNVVPREIGIPEEARDDVLLRRAAKGDEDAFTALYRRHQAAIYRFALRMTGNAWASEEIVQDVFMTLMREPKKYDAERAALAAYLYGIARNRIMKHLERLPREVALDEQNENGSRDALGRRAGTHSAGARRRAGFADGISRDSCPLRIGGT
jgi:DNA-directed RNA polymerase specialized sigma24 family protein